MMQAIFDRISKHGLTDWAVVLQGVSGIPGHSDGLPSSCVENFANAEIEKVAGDDPLLDVIVGLADGSDYLHLSHAHGCRKCASPKV
jgi:hypothetical protein